MEYRSAKQIDIDLRDLWTNADGEELRDFCKSLGVQLMAKYLCTQFRAGMIQYILTFNDTDTALREFIQETKRQKGVADPEERVDE